MQAGPDRYFPVTILTHEGGGPPPHEQALSQLLTDFFSSAGVGVHTLVLAGDLEKSADRSGGRHAHLTLVDSQLYKKECVQTTGDMTNQLTQVMFLQCHGIAKTIHHSAGLYFGCPKNEVEDPKKMNRTQTVLAWPTEKQKLAVSLNQIVGKCNLAIVLACNGDDVIEDYLKAASRLPFFPDMLVCNAPEMSSGTGEIFTVLLLNIVDSDLAKHPHNPHEVYRAVKAAIVRIFQIVKLFGTDHRGFWEFLKQVGCVNDLRVLKQRQQLEYPKRYDDDDKPRFRIPVSANMYGEYNSINGIEYDIPLHLLEQFRALELVCKRQKRKTSDDDMIDRVNWRSVDAIVLTDGTDRWIDQYLREYVPAPPASEFVSAPSPPDQETHMPGVNLLLTQLARLSC